MRLKCAPASEPLHISVNWFHAAGTQHAHRTLRTRLAWPVPLSEEEVPVLFKGVEAYVQVQGYLAHKKQPPRRTPP